MAVSLDIGVPWVMCQQADAPSSVMNACNGFSCDQFTPNSNSTPKMWTENWSGCTMVEPTLGSLVEDLLLLQVMSDAPLDEYGPLRQPKWGHLKDVHEATKLCEAAMVATDPTVSSLGQNIEGVEQATVAMPKFLLRYLLNLHLGRTQLIF